MGTEPALSGPPSGIQKVKTHLVLLVCCISAALWTLDSSRRSIRNQVWEETLFPPELLEEGLIARGYRRQKILAPIPSIPEIRLSDIWVHESNAWFIVLGELFVALKVPPDAPIPDLGWARYAPNLSFWKKWVELYPIQGTAESAIKAPRKTRKNSPLRDPREFTF